LGAIPLYARELFEAAEEFTVPPNTVIFRQGDDSSSGIYIVVEGSLGVYLQESQESRGGDGGGGTRMSGESSSGGSGGGGSGSGGDGGGGGDAFMGPPFLTNILCEGESVGDIDVLDNAPRGVSERHPKSHNPDSLNPKLRTLDPSSLNPEL
jgi:lysophospholipid hydrolase